MMKNLVYSIVIGLFLFACSSGYEKQPVDDIILKNDKEKNFTIVLYDMDVEGTFFKTYKHQYKVIKQGSGVGADTVPTEKVTEWAEVSKREFEKHELDMGMEIASKSDGKVTKQTAPPGYSNYVGNSRYGHWRSDSSGNSFWAFYGQYAFMSHMLGLHSGPIYRRNYSTYRSSYHGSRPYYGTRTSSGAYRYGTYSNSKSNSSRRYTKSSSYSSRRSSAVSRSSSSYSSKSGSRTSRSGSRYSGSSRSRSSSRGGK